jgi:hypothetical protein
MYLPPIKRDHLERRPSNWLSVSSAGDCFNDFPKLQEDDLRQLTLGVYQLKLAKSYSVEHLNTDGSYEMFVNKQDEGLLMGKIQSVMYQVDHISFGLNMMM